MTDPDLIVLTGPAEAVTAATDAPGELAVGPPDAVTLAAETTEVRLAVAPGDDVSLATAHDIVVMELASAAEPELLVLQAVAGGGGSGPVGYTAENRGGGPLPAGWPVAVHPSGVGAVGADAALAGRSAVGLLAADTPAGAGGAVRTAGPLTLPDWSAACGTTSLAARARYFLAAGGGLTPVPPFDSLFLQSVGVAVAPDTLDLSPAIPALL